MIGAISQAARDSKLALMKKGLRPRNLLFQTFWTHSKLALMKKGLRRNRFCSLMNASMIQNLP